MGIDPSTRRQLTAHLGQAEFSLKVTQNFACLRGSPVEAAVITALAQVEMAHRWIREDLAVAAAPSNPTVSSGLFSSRNRANHRSPVATPVPVLKTAVSYRPDDPDSLSTPNMQSANAVAAIAERTRD